MPDVYLDNAATTYPKPDGVYEAVDRFSREEGGNPGRSGHHRSLQSGREVLAARNALAALLRVDDSSRIVFTKNATEALNMVIQYLLRDGGHAAITSLEHNSVWRPLEALAGRGNVSYTIVESGTDGSIDAAMMIKALRPDTRLMICTHASNVMGNILPVEDMAELAAEREIPLLVDAAQTAGRLPLYPQNMGIHYLAFSGHKELFGPQGTGALYTAPGWDVGPLIFGGTGSLSESALQPDFLPDSCESGTINTPGLVGLHAGIRFVLGKGLEDIRRHESDLTSRLMDGLEGIPGAEIYGPRNRDGKIGVVSFNLEGFTSTDVASRLDEAYGICVRSGLHCAPLAHRTQGTLKRGAVRASFSRLNQAEEVDYLLRALSEIAGEGA